MKRRWNENALRLREDGMEAIDGLLVITLMLFVLFFIWGYGFLLFQQFTVVHAANEAANKIAQTYAYSESDPITGYVSKATRTSLSPYRYIGGNLKSENQERAEKYGKWLLKTESFAQRRSAPQIETNVVYDGPAQKHVVVKISAEYYIPFGSFLELFGIKGVCTYSATGRAVCKDISHYINTVNYVNDLDGVVEKAADNKFVSTTEKILSAAVKLIQYIYRVDD